MSKKILIVDDEKDILELLDYHLTKEGYITMKAFNGKDALKMYQDMIDKTENCKCIYRTYRLILMDLSMPVMDGSEASKKILKAMPKIEGSDEEMTQIVAVTSHTNVDIIE